jgi:hypothetical protein
LPFDKCVFQKVFKIAEVSKLSKEEKAMYDSNLKSRWDYENSVAFAAEEAEHKKAVDIAREMKKDGISIAQIVKFTKLSVKEVEKL